MHGTDAAEHRAQEGIEEDAVTEEGGLRSRATERDDPLLRAMVSSWQIASGRSGAYRRRDRLRQRRGDGTGIRKRGDRPVNEGCGAKGGPSRIVAIGAEARGGPVRRTRWEPRRQRPQAVVR